MAKQIDSSNIIGLLEDAFGRIRAAFWKKGDTQQLPIDNAPTKSSVNLVKSGGVYSEIHPAIQTVKPSELLPNVFYNLGLRQVNTTFTLATPSDATIVNHYYWTFETGSTAPTITWPTGITWVGGSAPVINANKHYEISIINNIGTFIEV